MIYYRRLILSDLPSVKTNIHDNYSANLSLAPIKPLMLQMVHDRFHEDALAFFFGAFEEDQLIGWVLFREWDHRDGVGFTYCEQFLFGAHAAKEGALAWEGLCEWELSEVGINVANYGLSEMEKLGHNVCYTYSFYVPDRRHGGIVGQITTIDHSESRFSTYDREVVAEVPAGTLPDNYRYCKYIVPRPVPYDIKILRLTKKS